MGRDEREGKKKEEYVRESVLYPVPAGNTVLYCTGG
jgi:hypothetical protein